MRTQTIDHLTMPQRWQFLSRFFDGSCALKLGRRGTTWVIEIIHQW